MDFFSWDSKAKNLYKRKSPQTDLFGYTAKESTTEVFDGSKPVDSKETFECSLNGADLVPTENWQKCRSELCRQFSRLYLNTLALLARGVLLGLSIS